MRPWHLSAAVCATPGLSGTEISPGNWKTGSTSVSVHLLVSRQLLACLVEDGRILFTLDPTLGEAMNQQQLRVWRTLAGVGCQCFGVVFKPGDSGCAGGSTPRPYSKGGIVGGDMCYREDCVDVYVAMNIGAKRGAVPEPCVDTTTVGGFGCTRQSWKEQLAAPNLGPAKPMLDAYTTAVKA